MGRGGGGRWWEGSGGRVDGRRGGYQLLCHSLPGGDPGVKGWGWGGGWVKARGGEREGQGLGGVEPVDSKERGGLVGGPNKEYHLPLVPGTYL